MLWLLFLLPTVNSGAEELRKLAVLFLPDQIECRSGDGARLEGEIGFRWDENEPLYLGLWSNSKTGRNDVLGDIKVFDEKGRELDKVLYVTLPRVPDGEIVVNKGDMKRFGIYQMYSTVIFLRPGNYYGVASFSYAASGKRSVSFTTNKRWFRVVEAAPKPKKA